RHPVADDREAGQRRGVKGLEDDPVADHVLDALGRHADEREEEILAVVAVLERPELGGRGGRREETTDPDQRSLTVSTILPVWASLSMYLWASWSASKANARSSTGLSAPLATASPRWATNRSLHWSDSSGVRVRNVTPMIFARLRAISSRLQSPENPALRPTLTSRPFSASVRMFSGSMAPPTW